MFEISVSPPRTKKYSDEIKMDTGINPNSVLKLNVGGKQFVTTQGTLLSDQNSMLARMFSTDTNGRIPATQDANGAFFIDRCPKYFGVVLNFLRSGKLENVANVDLKFLRNEAEYFCIQGKIKAKLINRFIHPKNNDIFRGLLTNEPFFSIS